MSQAQQVPTVQNRPAAAGQQVLTREQFEARRRFDIELNEAYDDYAHYLRVRESIVPAVPAIDVYAIARRYAQRAVERAMQAIEQGGCYVEGRYYATEDAAGRARSIAAAAYVRTASRQVLKEQLEKAPTGYDDCFWSAEELAERTIALFHTAAAQQGTRTVVCEYCLSEGGEALRWQGNLALGVRSVPCLRHAAMLIANAGLVATDFDSEGGDEQC